MFKPRSTKTWRITWSPAPTACWAPTGARHPIARDPRFADVPIIMCTSKNQETDRVWGMRQGARDYITKPVDQAELMAKIKALG